jgi:hypothetical protein
MTDVTPTPPLEEALLHISDLLKCAVAVAYEAGDNLSGSKRDLVFSVMHMITSARKDLEQTLASIEMR